MSEEFDVKVETKEPGPIRRELRIEVEADVVGAEMERVLTQVSRGARIPGFRSGKVPREILRKRYAREIENEILEHLVPRAVHSALHQTSLIPLHEPAVTEVTLESGKPLQFTASFEIRPTIEPIDYKGVVVQKSDVKVDESDVDSELDQLRERAAQYDTVDARPLEVGDHALVDMWNDAHGQADSQENVLIEVGGKGFHPEFTRQVTGAGPGDERAFEVTYDDDDEDPQARGKTVSYKLTVREVKKKVLSALDDDFAADLGAYETLADLKKEIRGNLESRLEREVRRDFENQIARALVGSVEIEVPNVMVEQELDRAIEDQARMLMMQGVDPNKADIDWRAARQGMREEASRTVEWRLLLDAIGEKEKIEVPQEAIDERLQKMADGAKKSLEFIRTKIEKDGRMEELTGTIRLEKTVDFILDNAKMEAR